MYSVIAESIQQARVAMGKRAYDESRALLSEALTAEPDNFEGGDIVRLLAGDDDHLFQDVLCVHIA